MARLERVVYRSPSACVLDVIAYGAEEIALEPDSVAFVRSGYFAMRSNQTSAIVDPNYVIFAGASECLFSGACKHISACTIVRYGDGAAASSVPGCAIASPRTFFLQAQLLHDARLGRRNPEPQISKLLYEMSGDSAIVSCAHSRLVTEIRRLLNESPSKRVSLDAIAGEFYTSPFTVSRVFHRETGMRLRDYSSRLRLRKALQLLLHSRKNLTSIAIDLGFYDESHFSKAFRAEFGVCPYSVRKY
ncbi:MAG TPA: AraC family transcriptional regulator [Candidatus Baltobacteraceae bacterium]|nr:AraC family transcriptional regulator [Candidatus Baltobacteraceae bacterium]